MSILNIAIKYTGPVPGSANLGQREFNDLVREAWSEVGAFWHQRFLKKHFTVEGGKEYDYAPRSGDGKSGKAFWRSYQGRKQRKYGHQNPLEWSGDLKQRAQVARITTTATSSGSTCKVTLPQAQKANFKNKWSDPRLDMADELTRVSDAEGDEIVEMFNDTLQGKLEALEYAREVSQPIGGFAAVGMS